MWRGQPRRRAGSDRSISAISDEPPPMSNSTTPSVSRLDQRAAAGDGQPRLGLAVDDFEVEPGLGRDPREEFGAVAARGRPRWRSAGRGARRVAQLAGADLERLDRAVHRRLGQPAARRRPSPRRTIREKASTTRNAAAGRDARSAAGNCWCRGRARQTPADRDCGAAAAAPAWRAAGPEARRAPALGAAAVPHRRGEARPAPRQRRHGRGRTLCGRGDVCGACARAAVRRRRATHGERPLRKVRRDRRPAAPPSRSAPLRLRATAPGATAPASGSFKGKFLSAPREPRPGRCTRLVLVGPTLAAPAAITKPPMTRPISDLNGGEESLSLQDRRPRAPGARGRPSRAMRTQDEVERLCLADHRPRRSGAFGVAAGR